MINLIRLFFVILIFISNYAFAQIIEETLISEFDVPQNAEVFDFSRDSATGKFCYVIWNIDHTFGRVLYENMLSEPYGYLNSDKIRFFSDGSYAAYGESYSDSTSKATGTVIVNGKNVYSSEYIDWYSSYINSKDELISISKEGEKYFLIRYSLKNGVKKSSPYDELRAAFTMKPSRSEEGDEYIMDDEYLVDDKGERLYVGVADNKAFLIQGENSEETPYSDIDYSSMVYDRSGKLCYIAKTNGGLYSAPKGFFVVQGEKKFKSFDYIYPPLLFDAANSIYYVASDSVGEYVYDSYLVKNDKRISAQSSGNTNDVTSSIQDVSISPDGNISYVAWHESKQPVGENGESYNTTHSYVSNGREYFLGYNLRPIVRAKNGDLLYVAQSKLGNMQNDLYTFNGNKVSKVNKGTYDEIYGYDYTPDGKIYYIGMKEDKSANTYTTSDELFIGDVKIGNYGYLVYQTVGDSAQALVYSGNGDYAFVADEKVDENQYYSSIYVNGNKLPRPVISEQGSNQISNVFNLFYSVNGKMFYIATTKTSENYSNNVMEAFVDNVSTGKTYNSIGKINYDPVLNTVSFLASRSKGIYEVKIFL